MSIRPAVRAAAGLLIATALSGSGAAAAPPGEAPPAEAAQREQARALYEEGMAHFKKDEYREAYDALQKSLALKKTRGAMATAASCLKQLGRYDEALLLYEEALREFPDPDPRSSFRVKIDAAVAELQGLVGTLVVVGDVPGGAALFVDERRHGGLPLSAPLRLSVGMHRVRVEKEGFDPITATVEVKAQQESVAELAAPSRKGRLVVSELHNWPLHVELDGKDVGVTPWEGLVEVGEHRVRLHGFVDPEALEMCAVPEVEAGAAVAVAPEGAKMASPERATTVRLYETTPVMLRAEEQDASLRIDSTPGGAKLVIDRGIVVLTPWEGRMGLGEHVIEVSADGFLPAKKSVWLERRKRRELTIVLTPLQQGHRRTVVVAGAVAAATAAGLGVAFSAMAVRDANDADEKAEALRSAGGSQACALGRRASDCEALLGLRADASNFTNAAAWSFIGAGAMGVGTLIYWLAERTSETQRGVRGEVVIGPDVGGLVVRGTW